jgi:hypothetical protein
VGFKVFVMRVQDAMRKPSPLSMMAVMTLYREEGVVFFVHRARRVKAGRRGE